MNTPSLGQSHFFLVCSGKAGQVMHPRKNKKQVSCREIATLSDVPRVAFLLQLIFCSSWDTGNLCFPSANYKMYFIPHAFPQTPHISKSICTTEQLFVNPPTQPQNSSGKKNYIALITETIPRNNSTLPLPSDLQTSLLGNTTLYNTNQPLELPKKRLKEKKRS